MNTGEKEQTVFFFVSSLYLALIAKIFIEEFIIYNLSLLEKNKTQIQFIEIITINQSLILQLRYFIYLNLTNYLVLNENRKTQITKAFQYRIYLKKQKKPHEMDLIFII